MNLDQLCSSLTQLATRLEGALSRLVSKLSPVLHTVQRILDGPPVRGYEAFFAQHVEPDIAKMSAHVVRYYGRVTHQEHVAKQIAATILLDLQRQSTPLTIKRRATRLRLALAPHGRLKVLADACARSSVTMQELESCVQAAEQGRLAALQLPNVAARLIAHLPSPKGRGRSLEYCTHEILLAVCNDGLFPRAYTYSDFSEDFVDPLTQATREAFGSCFDPRRVYFQLVDEGEITPRRKVKVAGQTSAIK